MQEHIKLTQYSHGAGCGCKIAPNVLDQILASGRGTQSYPQLLVGNESKDDAAVFDLGNGDALISTTDFFMPIVDDAFEFGAIASANAISDVYAMGGKPIMAIAILGWPINTLPPEVAGMVLDGSRYICQQAGIPLAGGHSIDAPEPIFGLAVNGMIKIDHLKKNKDAKSGDHLLLTKALGVGILTTAEKKGILSNEHIGLASSQMMKLNSIGSRLSRVSGVSAMTDVTGFGLLGHLMEICQGSKLSAQIFFDRLPMICEALPAYVEMGSVPGGSQRNWASYSDSVSIERHTMYKQAILTDPQTSGGLLISVSDEGLNEVMKIFEDEGLNRFITPIGRMTDDVEKVKISVLN